MTSRIAALLVLLPFLLSAQGTDTTPPTLTAFHFLPAALDTTHGPAPLTISAEASDDLSGVGALQVALRGAPPQRDIFVMMYPSGGDSLHRSFGLVYSFPQHTMDGAWTVAEVNIWDVVGNKASYSTSTLSSQGFPASFTVISTPDLEGPKLVALGFDRSTLHSYQESSDVRVLVHLIDPVSGVDMATNTSCGAELLAIAGPKFKQNLFAFRGWFKLVSGTKTDGIWEYTLRIPQYAENGIWTNIQLFLPDAANNCSYISIKDVAELELWQSPPSIVYKYFEVSSGSSDITPPQLQSLTIEPAFINTTLGPATVKIRAHQIDDLSGVSWTYPGYWVGAFLRSPSTAQWRGSSAVEWVPPNSSSFARLIGGSRLDGTWEIELVFPQYSEAGTWTLNIDNWDTTYNMHTYQTSELQSLNLPASVIVILPSGEPDGTIDGSPMTTISDRIFGERARIDCPGGVLPRGTEVAIDVLDKPPAIPVPQGFQSYKSFFVNIELSPHPGTLFPAPGLDITIPLQSTFSPGTKLALLRVNPTLATLVPAVDYDGGVVLGVANADGVSATFKHVASLSTVVAAVPSPTGLGDLDSSGTVDCGDLAIVKASFGKRRGQPGYDDRADVNKNGMTDINDLVLVSRQLPKGISCR